jgi:hypothetical protein
MADQGGTMTMTPTERLIAAADLLDAPPTDEVGQALAEWLRCASRVLAAKPTVYQQLVDQRRVLMDGMLGHALNVADRLLVGAS